MPSHLLLSPPPSGVTISGTLILDGNLISNDNIEITSTGIVIPVPDEETKNSFFSYQSNSYIWANGQGRCINLDYRKYKTRRAY